MSAFARSFKRAPLQKQELRAGLAAQGNFFLHSFPGTPLSRCPAHLESSVTGLLSVVLPDWIFKWRLEFFRLTSPFLCCRFSI
jgi:hypothetical protein